MNRSWLVAIFPCILLSVGCLTGGPIDSTSSEAGGAQTLGSFDLSSERLGHLTVSPSTCTAGDQQFFLGADFEDEKAGMVVRLVVDPIDGPAARVFASATPFEKTVVFRRGDCRIFDFSLDSTGWRVDRVEDYSLKLHLDCSNEKGDSIWGKASTTHCH